RRPHKRRGVPPHAGHNEQRGGGTRMGVGACSASPLGCSRAGADAGGGTPMTVSTPCCGLHREPVCCDVNDCGPCCENCPTCSTLLRQAVARWLVVTGYPFDWHPAEPPPVVLRRAIIVEAQRRVDPDERKAVAVMVAELGGWSC